MKNTDGQKKIGSALISVFNKDGLEEIVRLLHKHKIKIISTGGTAEFIRKLKIPVTEVETLTGFPSVFGGRVKTLQPQIFGGILNRRDNKEDQVEKKKHHISDIDLVIVDLYPFEETLAKYSKEAPTLEEVGVPTDNVGKEIIEKIDIGGVSLIRAAAKNFNDVVVVPSKDQYQYLTRILKKGGETTLEERRYLAGKAFGVTGHYDNVISGYFTAIVLRYGENPHQKAYFLGDLKESFDQLQGKELSYNNFLDTEAAINLVYDFKDPAFAIIKHMNACGLAVRPKEKLLDAYKAAYNADPLSAFGGILAANREIDADIAKLIKKQELFVEVIIAPNFSKEALKIFEEKKNIRVLKWKNPKLHPLQARTCLSGMLLQERDGQVEKESDLKIVTKRKPAKQEISDLLIAAVATKHLKSNAIALVKNGTLISMGCGQTSRIDALKQAVEKAKRMKFSLKGAVMSSEAFFPFPDCVEVAAKAGIIAVIQPGGSKNDEASIKMADKHKMAMVMSGFRHFKH